ncbi:MAG: hypothetical protein J3T61_10140 [Candidatus Brocadiales bacterium]|nr:hypothetical protein [Candidatus Bathyanammoxibius sp.]
MVMMNSLTKSILAVGIGLLIAYFACAPGLGGDLNSASDWLFTILIGLLIGFPIVLPDLIHHLFLAPNAKFKSTAWKTFGLCMLLFLMLSVAWITWVLTKMIGVSLAVAAIGVGAVILYAWPRKTDHNQNEEN